MDDTQPSVSTAGDGEQASAAASILESLQRAETPEAFFVGLLHGQIERSEAMHGVVWLAGGKPGESVRLLREEPARVGQQAAEAWRIPLARQASAVFISGTRHVERVSEPADRMLQGRAYWGVGLPVPLGNQVAAVLTLVLIGREQQALDYARAADESVTSQGLLYGTLQAGHSMQQRYEELCQAWDIVAGVNTGYPDPEHMALALVNKAKGFLDVQRVSLGWVRRGKVKLGAISEQDYIDKRTNLSRALVTAMGEADEAERPIIFPPPPDDESALAADPAEVTPAHAALADLTEDHSIASYPLRAGEDTVAVVTFERQRSQHFSNEERRLQSVACEQIGPLLGLARRNHRNILARLRDAGASLIEKLFGKGHVIAKLVALGILAALAIGIFGRWTLKVSGTARLAPATRRVYAAPFDRAILSETMVLPGQIVRKDDPLFRFEDEELQLALREARSKLTETQAKLEVHFAKQEMAEVKIAKAQIEDLTAQVDILEHRIARAVVYATFDGVVLSGDLRQLIGSPFQMGQTLLEVAPLRDLLLFVEAEQGDVALVEVGQNGTFATKARPNVTLDFIVEKVRPMSEVREQANVFIIEAHVYNGPHRLTAAQVAGWPGLCRTLAEQAESPAPSPARAVWECLSEDARTLVRAAAEKGTLDDAGRADLLAALNALLARSDFYREDLFQGTPLPREAWELLHLERDAMIDTQLRRLNGLLLQAALPRHLADGPRTADGWLRPGMEAAANIGAGKCNITYAFTRKIIDWLRLKIFF